MIIWPCRCKLDSWMSTCGPAEDSDVYPPDCIADETDSISLDILLHSVKQDDYSEYDKAEANVGLSLELDEHIAEICYFLLA